MTSIHPKLLANIPFEHCSEVSPSVQDAVEILGLTCQVQAATIPASLAGHDIMAQAKTGTGKTVAFLIPSIQPLLLNSTLPSKDKTSVLILSPTRELAMQIAVAAEGLVKGSGLGVRSVIGGTNIKSDVKGLQTKR